TLGQIDVLLATHVAALTAGYFMVFATGIVAVVALVDGKSERLERVPGNIDRLISQLSKAGSVMVAVGIVLGMVWANRNIGFVWKWAPVETGALLIFLSPVITLLAHFRSSIRYRTRAAVASFGLLVVPVGWFGARGIEIPS